MSVPDERERSAALQRDAERAAQLREGILAGQLQRCPKCKKPALFWNSHTNNGEGHFECLACGKAYPTEHDLYAAEYNARNEAKYRDSQMFSD